jgi:hypothetical protein
MRLLWIFLSLKSPIFSLPSTGRNWNMPSRRLLSVQCRWLKRMLWVLIFFYLIVSSIKILVPTCVLIKDVLGIGGWGDRKFKTQNPKISIRKSRKISVFQKHSNFCAKYRIFSAFGWISSGRVGNSAHFWLGLGWGNHPSIFYGLTRHEHGGSKGVYIPPKDLHTSDQNWLGGGSVAVFFHTAIFSHGKKCAHV